MWYLFQAEFKRNLILWRRYWAETMGGVVATTVVFYGFFLSAQYISGPGFQFGDRLDSVIVGYVLWAMLLFIMGDMAAGLQREAQAGTLEQLFLSPFGAVRLFIVRSVANLAMQLGVNVLILGIILGLTGRSLAFPPTLVLPLTSVLLAAYGFALMLGSLALLFKQVQRLLEIVNFALLLVLTLPIETWSGSARWLGLLLPMTPGAGLLRSLMARGEALDWGQWLLAMANGAVYFGLGIFTFQLAEQTAKAKGKLGGY
jgi:ABC-2 type transport system permease protein